MTFPKRGIIIATTAAISVGGGSAVVAKKRNVFDRKDDACLDGGQQLLSEATVSVEQALQSAWAERPGSIDKVALDREADWLVYDIEIDDISVFVDATTGEIVPATELVQYDDRDWWDNGEPVTGKASITPEQAVEIARGEIDGQMGESNSIRLMVGSSMTLRSTTPR